MSTCTYKADQIDNSIKVLRDMLECNVECAGEWKSTPWLRCRPEEYVEWLHKNLPALNYVTDRILDYIFSNGFTTGDEEQDIELDRWMYATNVQGVVNYNVLRSAVKNTMIYGHAGVRYLSREEGIVSVHSRHYGTITDILPQNKGVKIPIGYVVSTEEEYIWDIDLSDVEYPIELFNRYGYITSSDEKVIILDPEEFLNLKYNPDDMCGTSPLLYDKQRLDLLMSTYQRLNYDIEYDGPGRIILHMAETNGDAWGNEVSTSKQLGTSDVVKEGRTKRAQKEVTQIAQKIKNSSSDSVIALSQLFSSDITHLPRSLKATELLSYVGEAGEILCQVYGMPPALLELGKVFGNVSMQKIIDNAIMNSVIPYRERFATPISNFLAQKLGFNKIFFNKYDLEQIADENEGRLTVADIIKTLEDAGFHDLAEQFAEQLGDDISAPEEPATNRNTRSTLSIQKNPWVDVERFKRRKT